MSKSPVDEVLDYVRRFMACIKAKDRPTMSSMILPQGYGTIIRNGAPLTMSLQDIVDRTPWDSPVEVDEQIYDEIVHVDHDLAVAWTPYRVLIDGKLHHEGTNIISLWKGEQGWVVTGVADTSRTPEGSKYERLTR